MVARAEIARGRVYLLNGSPVTVVAVPEYSPLIIVRREDGTIAANVLPHDLSRVAARRMVTLKEVAKAYGGGEAVQRVGELLRRKA